MTQWNANQYTLFENERTQPAVDLIRRIQTNPRSVLDISCGPGNSTHQLSLFFPNAEILGVDSSDAMLEKARATHPNLHFKKCAVPEELQQTDSYDLIFSNACLHWIPNHAALFPKLMAKLNSGGILAVQMPLVQEALFYRLLHQLVSGEKWGFLRSIQNFHNLSSDETYAILSALSQRVTMWKTTYFHVVPSHSAVIEWYKGSGLRPYLEALSPGQEREFLRELLDLIASNYPVQADSTVILKMPRLFFTAVR